MTPHDDLEQRIRRYLERRAQAPVPPPGLRLAPSVPRGRVVRAMIAAVVVVALAGGVTGVVLVTRRPPAPPLSSMTTPSPSIAATPSPTGAATTGDCTAETVRIGEVTAFAGSSTADSALWFVTLPIRATSGSCTLVLPREIAVASTQQGPFHDVFLTSVSPTSMVLSSAAGNSLTFGASWPLNAAMGATPPPACMDPIADINVLRVPIGDSSLEVSTGQTWAEVCQDQGPTEMGIDLEGCPGSVAACGPQPTNYIQMSPKGIASGSIHTGSSPA